MCTLIKNLRNKKRIIFDAGQFDNWCVYVLEADGTRIAPRDSTYFTELQRINQGYPNNKIYTDFIRIYNRTTCDIDEGVLRLIDEIVATYNEGDQISMEKWFTVIYGGMIAEEKKEGAILKKRIKRLGMYQVLIQKMNPEDAANFSRGRTVKELSPLMKSYGF